MNSPLLTLQPKYYVVKELRVVCEESPDVGSSPISLTALMHCGILGFLNNFCRSKEAEGVRGSVGL